MKLETKRLYLRNWTEEDAEALYHCAKNPKVGPMAGWPAHQNVKESLKIIQDLLLTPYTFALILKEKNEIIGNVSLNIEEENPSSAELGCWMDAPFWGQELGVEALREVIRFGFQELKLKELWASHFEENHQSRRLQEKCGLQFRYKKENVNCPLIYAVKTKYFNYITREEWLKSERGIAK